MKTLPEKWCFKITKENYEEFRHLRWLGRINGYLTSEPYDKLPWGWWMDSSNLLLQRNYTEITFEQFKKYVLKEDIYENNEGSVFEIGDEVTVINPKGHYYGQKLIITGFFTNREGNLIALLNNHNKNGIRIDNLQHFIVDYEYNKVQDRKLMFPKLEYEILSFIFLNTIYKQDDSKEFFISDDGFNDYKIHRTLEFMLRNPNTYQIHSVKRLADDEVFTIGDKTSEGILKNIEITKAARSGCKLTFDKTIACLCFRIYDISTNPFLVKKEKEDKLVYYMDNGSIFPRFQSIALQKPEILHFETIEDCKEFYAKPKISNKIWSFKNNTGTGAFYIYNPITDLYESTKSDAKIPYSECINRYPINRVKNTEQITFTVDSIIKQLGPRFRKEYIIVKFKTCEKTKKIYALCIPNGEYGKELKFKFEIDKITIINN